VVNVYQIAMVATLLPLAALGEVIGYHRIYLGGLLLFTLASLLCACAGSLPSLLTARVLQGLGAGGIMGVNTALVRFVYPGPLQGRGFGYNALVVATAFAIGPTIASGILAIGPWTWLFVINVPFGVVAILIGLNTLPRTPRAAHAFDFAGALMAAGCLGLLILGIGSAAHYERSGFISIELASAVLLGWTLIRRQAASPAPVLPIDLFRRPIFARSTATAICSFAVQASLSSPCHSTSRTFSAGRRSRPDFS
jgi:DHA2 family multidrug resistance protein-like MFS transporter